MSTQVNVYEAKTRLSQLLDQAVAGEEVIIARNGMPLARLVPIQRQPERRELGTLEGQIWVADDFDETPSDLVDLFYEGPVEPA